MLRGGGGSGEGTGGIMSLKQEDYSVCPECGGLYESEVMTCFSCLVKLRPATQEEVDDFERLA